MSDEPKSDFTARPDGEPEAARATVPMWLIALMLTLLFLGGVYFDHHSGWFSSKVYGPFASAEQLELYQPKSGAAALLALGRQKYELNCGICHGVDGLGKPAQAPPLAGSQWVNTKGDKRLIEIPLSGLNGPIDVEGQTMNFPSGMVGIGKGMSDADLAAVLTYIRASWGNHGGPVTDADVKAVRAAAGGHSSITAAQLKDIPE